MKMKAAVLHKVGEPLRVENVELDGPKWGEVLVKLVACSVCHTDVGAARHGSLAPVVLGHEGAGIVEDVGPGVKNLKPGDHVVLTGAASCGICHNCVDRDRVMCESFRPFLFRGTLPGGQRLHTRKGQAINHFMLQSAFAEYSVLPQEAAVKVRPDASLDIVCTLGCGALTGLGAIINRARPAVGGSVLVMGCGGVGLSGVMGAKLAGAGRVIAVDVLDVKLEAARKLGATDVINPKREKVVDKVRQLFEHGVDCAFVAVDAATAFDEAFASIRFGGVCVLIAGPWDGIKVNMYDLIREKSILGSSLGSGLAAHDIPMYVDFFMQGKLPLDRLVTGRYPLSRINQAFQDQEKGKAIKPVIVF